MSHAVRLLVHALYHTADTQAKMEIQHRYNKHGFNLQTAKTATAESEPCRTACNAMKAAQTLPSASVAEAGEDSRGADARGPGGLVD